jgi:hypothetical protein
MFPAVPESEDGEDVALVTQTRYLTINAHRENRPTEKKKGNPFY